MKDNGSLVVGNAELANVKLAVNVAGEGYLPSGAASDDGHCVL